MDSTINQAEEVVRESTEKRMKEVCADLPPNAMVPAILYVSHSMTGNRSKPGVVGPSRDGASVPSGRRYNQLGD